jgi:hypothetical protein
MGSVLIVLVTVNLLLFAGLTVWACRIREADPFS